MPIAPQVGKSYVSGFDTRLYCVADMDAIGARPKFGRPMVMVAEDGTLHSYSRDGYFVGSNCPDGVNDLVAEYVPPPEPVWVPFSNSDAAVVVGRKVRMPTWFDGLCCVVLEAWGGPDGTPRFSLPMFGKLEEISAKKLFDEGYVFVDDGTPCGKQVTQ